MKGIKLSLEKYHCLDCGYSGVEVTDEGFKFISHQDVCDVNVQATIDNFKKL